MVDRARTLPRSLLRRLKQSQDIRMLQTQASIDALLVHAYSSTLGLAIFEAAAPSAFLKSFVTTALDHHRQHAAAFNAAAHGLGGAIQQHPDPHYAPIADSALKHVASLSTVQGVVALIDLAVTLEQVAAQTCINNAAAFIDAKAKRLTASVMGIEAQHVSALQTVRPLVAGGGLQPLVETALTVAGLPASIGSAGLPDAFAKTNLASPPDEGAVP